MELFNNAIATVGGTSTDSGDLTPEAEPETNETNEEFKIVLRQENGIEIHIPMSIYKTMQDTIGDPDDMECPHCHHKDDSERGKGRGLGHGLEAHGGECIGAHDEE